MTRLAALAKDDAKKDELRDLVLLLHDQASLAESGSVEDPSGFAKRLGALLGRALG
ncbi:MAG TPA: hypothetical protein VIF62_23450 [Labilithrix sp.]